MNSLTFKWNLYCTSAKCNETEFTSIDLYVTTKTVPVIMGNLQYIKIAEHVKIWMELIVEKKFDNCWILIQIKKLLCRFAIINSSIKSVGGDF